MQLGPKGQAALAAKGVPYFVKDALQKATNLPLAEALEGGKLLSECLADAERSAKAKAAKDKAEEEAALKARKPA